jgi:hypothetical protein
MAKPLKQTDYDELATFINRATGRGGLGPLEDSAVILNGLLFSPRLQASRIALLGSLLSGSSRTKGAAAQALVGFVSTGMLIIGLSKLAGAKVSGNPLSTDFGKIQIGKTRLDIWGGFQPYARFIAQFTMAKRKSEQTGSTQAENRAMLARRFARSKLMPTTGLVVDLAEGRDYRGEPVRATPQEVWRRLAPLFIQDLSEAIDKEGMTGVAKVTPAFFGTGVYTKRLPDWPELNEYFEKKTPREKLLYRRTHPEEEAKLFILGQVTTVKSPLTARHILRIMGENDVSPEDLREKGEVNRYQKLFGTMAPPGKQDPESVGKPRVAPRSQTMGTEMPPSERWEQATLWLDASLLKALDRVWNKGGKLTNTESRRLKRVWERIPFGERNFKAWISRTLRQAQASAGSEVQSPRR